MDSLLTNPSKRNNLLDKDCADKTISANEGSPDGVLILIPARKKQKILRPSSKTSGGTSAGSRLQKSRTSSAYRGFESGVSSDECTTKDDQHENQTAKAMEDEYNNSDVNEDESKLPESDIAASTSRPTRRTSPKAPTAKFDVGGRTFKVSRTLLEKYPETLLARVAREQEGEDADPCGTFIDRDGERFVHVLDYMRDGCVDLSLNGSKEAILRELKFYGFDPVDPSLIRVAMCLPDALTLMDTYKKIHNSSLKQIDANILELQRQYNGKRQMEERRFNARLQELKTEFDTTRKEMERRQMYQKLAYKCLHHYCRNSSGSALFWSSEASSDGNHGNSCCFHLTQHEFEKCGELLTHPSKADLVEFGDRPSAIYSRNAVLKSCCEELGLSFIAVCRDGYQRYYVRFGFPDPTTPKLPQTEKKLSRSRNKRRCYIDVDDSSQDNVQEDDFDNNEEEKDSENDEEEEDGGEDKAEEDGEDDKAGEDREDDEAEEDREDDEAEEDRGDSDW